MTTLGFDTATPATAACLLRGDGEAFEHVPSPDELTSRPAHGSELLPRIHELLERAGVGFGELDRIAVGVGPGTFTGLRVGIATARALAHAHALPVHPVSSLAALAAGIDAPLRLALIDARRGELFAALHDGAGEVWPPFVAAPETVAGRVREAALSPVGAGDGSVRFREVLEAAGVRVEPDGSQAHAVRALHVCRLAVAVSPVPPAAVLPDYLRAPDAQPQTR
ncbi:MAG TPA: tRNA (adenosine(37)-N6)-threonylcarbamoyltransferase complex dimerization subunit type 1 TsaB [Thermoleophilaceae bacterium]|jgi:tRNA threonylcarbamoyladenosine biosynthesis protein TsaB